MSSEILDRLDWLEQYPRDIKKPENVAWEELQISKNDPKSGSKDYWWAVYGAVHLSGYYSLEALLIALDKACMEAGYYKNYTKDWSPHEKGKDNGKRD